MCSVEDPFGQPVEKRLCPGVNCSLFGEGVFLMARPWQTNLVAHDVVGRMVEAGVGAVFILQVRVHVLRICGTAHQEQVLVLRSLVLLPWLA